MTLDELKRTLPSGLHDALIYGFRVDCEALTLALEVDVANDTPESEFRRARVTLAGLLSFEFDPRHRGEAFDGAGDMSMDTGSVEVLVRRPKGLPDTLPPGAFCNYIYLSEWESFIYVAAREAELAWKSAGWRHYDGPPADAGRPEAAGGMSFDELAASLPAGLLSARLHGFEVDCEAMTLTLDLEIQESAENGSRRRARVTLAGLLTFQCEPRRTGELITHRGPVTITCGPVGQWPEPVDSVPNPLPAGSFASYILLHEWDSCIYVAARAAALTWP